MKTTGDRIAICLLVSLAGCRHATVQDDPNWPSPGPVDVASLPPIHSVINKGTTDPDALLASRAPAELARAEARAGQAATAIVLGPLKGSQTPGATASNPVAEASVAPLPVSVPGDAPSQPPASAMPAPIQSVAVPAVASDLPPAIPAQSSAATPGLRDSAIRPVQHPNDSLPLPSRPSETSGVPHTAAFGSASQSSTTPDHSMAEADNPPKSPENGISGTPPKAIDFEGLPATAVSAGRVAAKIGTDIITVYDLNIAIQEWIRANVPSGQSIPRREGLVIARMVLSQMIDRILIIQEAHRLMKSEKQKEALFKQIDQVWQEQQIPPLLKKYKVDTPYELDQALKKQGRSLDAARKEFMDDAVAHEFMGMKLGGKIHVSLVEMRKYYNDHRQDYDRPEQLTWREIRIPIEPGSEPAALKQATEILSQLKAHGDFATLAKRYGKGPTADQGGLWETSPGAFAVAEINTALEALEPGQVSGIVETPKALFVVKLESRRAAGPARFDEVQAEIRKKISDEKLAKAASTYIQELRKSNVIYTIFDDTPDPRAALADNQLQRTVKATSPQPAATPPGLASPQSPESSQSPVPATGPQPGADTRSKEPLPNLNPAGHVPPIGTMGGPSTSPL